MDHVSFLQLLPTQPADSYVFHEPLDTFWLAGQCRRLRVQAQLRDHLGQEDHLLLSSQKIFMCSIFVG